MIKKPRKKLHQVTKLRQIPNFDINSRAICESNQASGASVRKKKRRRDDSLDDLSDCHTNRIKSRVDYLLGFGF